MVEMMSLGPDPSGYEIGTDIGPENDSEQGDAKKRRVDNENAANNDHNDHNNDNNDNNDNSSGSNSKENSKKKSKEEGKGPTGLSPGVFVLAVLKSDPSSICGSLYLSVEHSTMERSTLEKSTVEQSMGVDGVVDGGVDVEGDVEGGFDYCHAIGSFGSVAVCPTYEKKGIGGALVKAAEAYTLSTLPLLSSIRSIRSTSDDTTSVPTSSATANSNCSFTTHTAATSISTSSASSVTSSVTSNVSASMEMGVINLRKDLFMWYGKQGYEKGEQLPNSDELTRVCLPGFDVCCVMMRKQIKKGNQEGSKEIRV